jgi:hypothetical protein
MLVECLAKKSKTLLSFSGISNALKQTMKIIPVKTATFRESTDPCPAIANNRMSRNKILGN